MKHRKNKEALRAFRREARLRRAEGYSHDQMLQSHLPDIGRKVTVSQAEVKAFMQHEAAGRENPVNLRIPIDFDTSDFGMLLIRVLCFCFVFVLIRLFRFWVTLRSNWRDVWGAFGVNLLLS